MSANVVITEQRKRRPVQAGGELPVSGHTEESNALNSRILREQEPWLTRCWDWLNGDEGAGVAISFVVHAILLALMAIPVIHSIRVDQQYTTLITKTDEEEVLFDEEIDTTLPLPVPANAGGDPTAKLLDMQFNDTGTVAELNLSETTTPAGEEVAAGTDGMHSGKRVAEPENAVKVGKFSVWPWPIKSLRNLERPLLGEPGDFPAAGRDYLIVIRIQAPEGVRSLKITDFTGLVVGTDGYRQKIPDGCYQFTSSGKLMPIRLRPRIPVLNGTAELVLRVPGAAALVEDTIKIHSKTLNEEEELKLVFKPK